MRDGDSAVSSRLLAWYDRQARVLPWRVGPAERRAGARPDPYRVWLSEVMLQQTTVAAARGHFRRFTERWPGVADLAAASDEAVMAEWAGLGYYARARNLLACARAVVADHGGHFPQTEAGLRALPGIGPYTAAAVAAIAFDVPATVVDGNVERVVARLSAIETPLPRSRPELARRAATLTSADRPGDFAQAMMDLGATVCTPRKPDCAACPLAGDCAARARGLAAELPRKLARAAKPTRDGIAWVAQRDDGAWLLERRPDRGLLGGMAGWPTSGWDGGSEDGPPVAADWIEAGQTVRHTFSHFHLRLAVRVARCGPDARPLRGAFAAGLDPASLPTLMRKVLDAAQPALAADCDTGRAPL